MQLFTDEIHKSCNFKKKRQKRIDHLFYRVENVNI